MAARHSRAQRHRIPQEHLPPARATYLQLSLPHTAQNRSILLSRLQRILPQKVTQDSYSIFPFYSILTPSPTAETDEIITRRIAEGVTRVEDGAEGSKFGYILRGFPFNTNQALLLDRYLNGVNLAIHLRSPADSADYSGSIKHLLNYYDERVSKP